MQWEQGREAISAQPSSLFQPPHRSQGTGPPAATLTPPWSSPPASVWQRSVCFRGQSLIAAHPALTSRKGNNSPSFCQSPVPLSHLSHNSEGKPEGGDFRAGCRLRNHLLYLFSPVMRSAGSRSQCGDWTPRCPSSCDLGSHVTALCFSFPVCKTSPCLGLW